MWFNLTKLATVSTYDKHFQFIDKFNEVKEATRSAISKVTANGGSAVTPVTSANASPINARASSAAQENANDNLLEPPGILEHTLCKSPIRLVTHLSYHN